MVVHEAIRQAQDVLRANVDAPNGGAAVYQDPQQAYYQAQPQAGAETDGMNGMR